MTIDAIGLGLEGDIFSASLIKRFEYGVRIMKVVMDDIDEVGSLHQLIDELLGRRIVLVEFGPLCSQLVCFILYKCQVPIFVKRDGEIQTFQAMKLTASTIVGWIISLPGKTPHVTALGPSECVLVRKSPRLLIT